jgi:hypothetical protein
MISTNGYLRRRLNHSKVYVGRKDNPSFGKCALSDNGGYSGYLVFDSRKRIFARRCRSNLVVDRSIWTQQG